MSRWSTPRLWAYSIVLHTSVNRRSRLRSSSDRRPGSLLSARVGVEALDRLLEAVALDEPHRVVRPAVVVGAQAVDRDDPGMLQPAGDLGLEQEPTAAGRVVGVLGEDLLERDLAVELGVQGDEDGAQAAGGMGPQDAEPLAVGAGGAGGVAGGPVGVAFLGRARADVAERGLDRRAGGGQAVAGGAVDVDGGEASLGVAAVELQVGVDQGVQQRPVLGLRRAPCSTKSAARGLPGAAVQEAKARTSWSRVTRAFWRASRPKSRSRGASSRRVIRAAPFPGGERYQ